MNAYTVDPYAPSRLITGQVMVGDVPVGGGNPVRIQSMTNTSTMDVHATAAQAAKIAEAGAQMVRIAVANLEQVKALEEIRHLLTAQSFNIPLIADTHFNPEIAVAAAKVVEKVRINPGNFLSRHHWKPGKDGDTLKRMEEKLLPLLETCKKHNTALRIGSNHGSLSPRILYHWGNTPEGMVQSVMEFVHLCQRHQFNQLILSLKSSHIQTMVYSYRLLAHAMIKRGPIYPLHLGVTEAGLGEDGRIRSAAGTGALLLDGLGDTIRVSLTENPENEIEIAKMLAKMAPPTGKNQVKKYTQLPYSPFGSETPMPTDPIMDSPGRPIVVFNKPVPGQLYFAGDHIISPKGDTRYKACFVEGREDAEQLKSHDHLPDIIILRITDAGAGRSIIMGLHKAGIHVPILLYVSLHSSDYWACRTWRAALGSLFLLDGLVRGLYMDTERSRGSSSLDFSNSLLQSLGLQYHSAVFISCPGCGRTLFDLEAASREVKQALGHLKGLKIAVMGCIVNGPGEMADADYGFVGAPGGNVTIYRKKKPVAKNIPRNKALEMLTDLIKKNGEWAPKNSECP